MQSLNIQTEGVQSSGNDRKTDIKWKASDLRNDGQIQKALRFPKVAKYILVISFILNLSRESLFATVFNHDGSLLKTRTVGAERLGMIVVTCGALIAAYISDAICGASVAFILISIFYVVCLVLIYFGIIMDITSLIDYSMVAQDVIYGANWIILLVVGADQFQLPMQNKQLAHYFIWFYLSYKLGSSCGQSSFDLAHMTLKPCGFSEDCLPICILSCLASSSAIITYIIIFLVMPIRKKKPKKDTKLRPLKLIRCYFYALKMNLRKDKREVDDWLYRAHSKYGTVTVRQLRMLINVSLLFFSLPLFHALERLAHELWLQLNRSTITKIVVNILQPEAMEYYFRCLVVFWLLILRYGGTYILTYVGLKRPLQNIIFGAFLLVVASVISVALSLKATSISHMPTEYGQLRIYNPTNCTFHIYAPDITNEIIRIRNMSLVSFKHLQMDHPLLWINYTLFTQCKHIFPVAGQFNLTKGKAVGYYFRMNKLDWFLDDVEISKSGYPKVRILANTEPSDPTEIVFRKDNKIVYSKKIGNPEQFTIYPTIYEVKNHLLMFAHGEISVLLCYKIGKKLQVQYIIMDCHATVSILAAFPHYVIAALGHAIFHVNGLHFVYVEAPEGVKATFLLIWCVYLGVGITLTWLLDLFQIFTLSQNIIMNSMLNIISILILLIAALSYNYRDVDLY